MAEVSRIGKEMKVIVFQLMDNEYAIGVEAVESIEKLYRLRKFLIHRPI